MRALLDERVPRRLRSGLPGHHVGTVREMGWSGTRNGRLLSRAAASGFEVLLTVDRNLRHQQDPASLGVAVVVLIAPDNSSKTLDPLTPKVAAALTGLKPGQIIEIGVLSDGKP